MNTLTKKHTALEVAAEVGESVSGVLDRKLQELQSGELPVEAGLADYIALSISSMQEKKAQLKAYKKNLDEAIKALDEFEKETASEVNDWMRDNGIDKLKGIYCSSVTAKELSVSIRNKIVRDVSDAQLLEQGMAHQEEIITEIPAGIRINKRKKNEKE